MKNKSLPRALKKSLSFFEKIFAGIKKRSIFALAIKFTHPFIPKAKGEKRTGLVVQLVRIHACHAWGRGFESRPDRQKNKKHFKKLKCFFAQNKIFCCCYVNTKNHDSCVVYSQAIGIRFSS